MFRKMGNFICSNTRKMADIGQFLLGLASIGALYQTGGAIEKILEVREAVKKVGEAVDQLGKVRIGLATDKTISNPNPDMRIMAFKRTVRSDEEKLTPGDIYIAKDKYDKALDLLKSNDSQMQNSFLSENLKVWQKDHK